VSHRSLFGAGLAVSAATAFRDKPCKALKFTHAPWNIYSLPTIRTVLACGSKVALKRGLAFRRSPVQAFLTVCSGAG